MLYVVLARSSLRVRSQTIAWRVSGIIWRKRLAWTQRLGLRFGLDTEAHDEEQPEEDAISELGDYSPLCLRATEVERLQCCWDVTPTGRPRRRWSSITVACAELRRILATQTAAAAAQSSCAILVIAAGDLHGGEMWRRQLGHVRPGWGRLGGLDGPTLNDCRQRVCAVVSAIVRSGVHAWHVVGRKEAQCQTYRPLRTALRHVLLGVDIGDDDSHDERDWHHYHRRREEHPCKITLKDVEMSKFSTAFSLHCNKRIKFLLCVYISRQKIIKKIRMQ